MNQTIKKNTIQLAILLTSFNILFGQTMAKLAQDWMTNDNYSHGFLVPIIAACMIWQKKKLIKMATVKTCNKGLIIILSGMCIFFVGSIGAELFIMRTAMLITIAGVCLYYLGIRITAIIIVPIVYLMFMIPLPAILWNKIAFPLQLLAANLTSHVIQLLGIPLLREGNIMHLSNTTLEVVDACSGIRSMTTLFALSAAFAYISKLKKVSKWMLFLSAIPIAIAVNILRLTLTALLARYIGPQVAHGFLHDFSGFLIFIIALLILFGMYAALQLIERKIIEKNKV